MNISKRVNNIKVSPVRKLIPYQEEAVRCGKKVYHFNIGQPDLPTPPEFFEFIANSGETTLKYAHSKGNLGLRQAMSRFYKENFNLDFNEEEILITCGGSEALLFVLSTIFDVGDEILVSEPYYANYNSFFEMLEIKVNAFQSKAEEGFHLPAKEEILAKITPNTKAILLTNPGNPTGTVYTEEELKVIGDIAKEYNLFVISDEVYRLLSYDNKIATSMGAFPEYAENTVIIESISKTYSACGARIGAIVSKNKEFMSAVYKLCQARLSVSSLDMIGAEGLYNTLRKEYFDKNRAIYENRRDVIFEGLQKIDGVKVTKPEGAFYVMVTLPVDDSEKFAIWLLSSFDCDGETVMLTPAQGFYKTPDAGKQQVRITYCLEEDKIKKALNILEKGLIEYNKLNK
ncbi:pyridoxal phosphate-dependent aminotransferase [Fusobacterium perfoetens]|uniref:pyridoxal phosphate-dependent aminotransferase n=1 Tax=Fusobacterium perfoetens TaxID=852 RepID=UPI00048865E3|nr:pyridoxal phosphate-dependent aminotransferase [Fusobacterium perfoetens]